MSLFFMGVAQVLEKGKGKHRQRIVLRHPSIPSFPPNFFLPLEQNSPPLFLLFWEVGFLTPALEGKQRSKRQARATVDQVLTKNPKAENQVVFQSCWFSCDH